MIYHYKIPYQVHKWLEEEEIKSNTIITISTNFIIFQVDFPHPFKYEAINFLISSD